MPYTRPLTFEERHQHDAFGNAPELLDPKHAAKMESMYRAGGDVVCQKCGKVYYDHPNVVGALWLIELCNGDLVHL